MLKREVTLHSKMDQLPISVLISYPEKEPVAVLQLVHGMTEHKERYLPFMEYLNEAGYICVIHDHRGHGKSVRSKKDYGYFYENGKEALIEDTHQLTLYMKQKYKNLPYFLLGHSMGSLIVRCYMKRYDDEIDGLIVCGSPSNQAMVGLGIFLSKLMIFLKGDHGKGDFFQKLAFFRYNEGIKDSNSDNAWLSVNKENVRCYEEDPLCGFVFQLNGFLNLFYLMKETYSKKDWQLKNKELPICFLSGEEDPCLGNKKKFKKAVFFMKERGYQNTKAKLYPNMRHEILQETERALVYKDIYNLLKIWRQK